MTVKVPPNTPHLHKQTKKRKIKFSAIKGNKKHISWFERRHLAQILSFMSNFFRPGIITY